MKGAVTLAVYVAIGITGAAFGQSSTHVKTVKVPVADVAREEAGYFPLPAFAPLGTGAPLVQPPKLGTLLPPVVITFGNGGRVDEHRQRYADYRMTRTKVEVRGPCYSACTLVLAYVKPDNLCIAPGAFMAFHAIRSMEYHQIMVGATHEFYASMPDLIQLWI